MPMSGQSTPFFVTVLPFGGQFAATAEQDLISAMLAQGVAFLRYGCRKGNCGKCKARVLEGRYTHRDLNRVHVSEEQQSQGFVLPCQTFAQSDLSLRQDG